MHVLLCNSIKMLLNTLHEHVISVERHIGEAKPDFKATSTEQLDQWCSTLRRKAGTLQDKTGSDVGRNIISCADTLKVS